MIPTVDILAWSLVRKCDELVSVRTTRDSRKEYMRSTEVRKAAATRSTESPGSWPGVGVDIDASWVSEVIGGALRTLTPLPIYIY